MIVSQWLRRIPSRHIGLEDNDREIKELPVELASLQRRCRSMNSKIDNTGRWARRDDAAAYFCGSCLIQKYGIRLSRLMALRTAESQEIAPNSSRFDGANREIWCD